MSNTGKFKDRTPFLRVSGITSSVYGASADQSLRQDLYYQVLLRILFTNDLFLNFQ
jgi:hypothetical protein